MARKLDKQVMSPIRTLLGNARQILLSPDGQLTLIPFEALRDEKRQYLIQRYSISYLTSGRDLLRFPSSLNSSSAPVVLADIDYDNVETRQVASGQKNTSVDQASLTFDSLPGTKEEAAAVQKIFPNAKVLLGKQATESAVKQLQAPSILHLATHGFFLSDLEPNSNLSLTGLGQPQPKLQGENPLLRAGLALAGVNKRNQNTAGNDDGVLTALEVAGLNLHGTQLAVLSACETGTGDVKVGEGVYGLRRAFVIAGVQSQILSLWSVDDIATKDLMVNYYQKLKGGKGRHEALRETQLEFINTPGYEHPYFWASFVPSGDWGVLDRVR
ncbi:MAG: CHAT domain-containing protein [Tolypothrix carrinoi HA7290-LM1]|jgi:CHAT domain-containing protein|nr:CHAT domain-containing protein [Tolypothrix carrinoi HA7290-LM1]